MHLIHLHLLKDATKGRITNVKHNSSILFLMHSNSDRIYFDDFYDLLNLMSDSGLDGTIKYIFSPSSKLLLNRVRRLEFSDDDMRTVLFN